MQTADAFGMPIEEAPDLMEMAFGAWEGELGREVYQDYRDTLIRIGWARWNSTRANGKPNERRGWELTTDPAEILKRISG